MIRISLEYKTFYFLGNPGLSPEVLGTINLVFALMFCYPISSDVLDNRYISLE